MPDKQTVDYLLESTRTGLLAQLRKAAPVLSLATVQQFVASTEPTLMNFLPEHVRDICVAAASDRLWPVDATGLVGTDGSRYAIAVSPEIVAGLDLLISMYVQTAAGTARRSLETTAVLAAPGRYRKLRVYVPEKWEFLADYIVPAGQLILDAGYSWIADMIVQAMDGAEEKVTARLYGLSREIFPEDDLRKKLWFATVGPVYGFRLVSSEVTKEALRDISAFTTDLAVDPVDLLAELLTTRLPRQMLLMDKAAKLDSTINLNFADAGYSKSPSRYAFVMKSLYGGSSVSMMTLLRADNFAVLALFPTGHREISLRLEAHRHEFEEVARQLSGPIVKAASLFEGSGSDIDVQPFRKRVGVGRLLGDALDSVVPQDDSTKEHWRFKRRRSLG